MRSISIPEGDFCGSWLGALGFTILVTVGVCLSPSVAHAQVDCSATGTTGVPQIECEALMALYVSTNGTNWTDDSNWDTASAVSTWFGVAVSAGKVTGLSLGTNQLTGTIPPEIGDLSNLTTLYLSNNQLIGPIPSALPTCPTPTFKTVASADGYFDPGTSFAVPVPAGVTTGDLLIAQIGYNAAGTITPPTGWNLIDVTTNPSKPIMQGLYWRAASASEPTHYDFDLSSAKKDTAVGAIAAYRGIDVTDPIDAVGAQTDSGSTNIVAPSITTSTANTTLISFFSVRDDGTVTPPAGTTEQWDVNSAAGVGAIGETLLAAADEVFTIAGDTGIRVANAQNSDGSVAHLVALRPTQFVDPIANQLSGSIPPELGNLSNLTTLYLSGNQLTGPIPPALGNLNNLTTACLHSNQLTGPIPPEIGTLSSLDTLYLYNNQLTGPLPPEVGDLSNLTSLELSSNQLTGPIPSELGNLFNLDWLHLYGNQLSSDIPDLTSLPLSSLRFGSNAFVFADFESEFVAYNDGAPATFQYSPQAMVDTARTVSFPSGAPAVLPSAVAINPSGNDQYQWYKDGAPISGPYGTSRDLDVTLGGGSVAPADAGNYQYTISNAVVTGLTLTSRVITVAVSATCGDGFVNDPSEVCDDGNLNTGDGCDAACLLEVGEPCAGDTDCASNRCNLTAMPPVCAPPVGCGNGTLEAGEACDDGNNMNGDGCTAACDIEDGNPCTANAECASGVCDMNEAPPLCEPAGSCGNGALDATESCDDGNLTTGDGCSNICLLEDGEPCTDNAQCESTICDTVDSNTCEPANTCGNGALEAGEACDDGNTSAEDSCDPQCLLELGAGPCTDGAQCESGVCNTLAAAPVCAVPIGCGNGVLNDDEVCDDGNLDRGDGCSEFCTLENVWRGGGGCAVNRGSDSGGPEWFLSLLLLPLVRRRKVRATRRGRN
jgi:cysteine-rich repeat protein